MNSLVRLTKLILGAFAVLAFLAVLLTTVLLFLDLGWLRGQLESRATEAFGRQVTFAGAIHLKPSLWPTFMTEDFRIGNPAWASRPDFAQVERLEIQVALLPLFRGELQVLNITFRGADVFLEVGSDGTNNFTFGHSEGTSTLPAIDKFSVLDSVIGYRENGEELYRCAVVKAEATNMPKQPVQLAGEIACRDVPMRFSLSGGISEKFASPTVPWPLAVAVSTKDTSLVAKGSLLPGPDRWHGSPFQVSIKADTPASLETLFDVELPVQRSFELSGKFTGYKGVYTLTNLTGRIGSTDIAGKLQWQQTGKRPFLKGRIVSRSLYMQDFLATAEPNSADNAKSALLDQPIPLSWTTAIDAELALDVENVMDGPVSIDNAALTAKLGNGELSVSPLRATLAGIPLTGNIAINLRDSSVISSMPRNT